MCASTEQYARGHLQRCPEYQDIRDGMPKNMGEAPEAEKEFYLGNVKSVNSPNKNFS
jgi:hypothetical protein